MRVAYYDNSYLVYVEKSSSWEPHLRATGRHLPYGITQCYLPPDTSERAPSNPSYAGWYSIYLPRWDGRLSWASWLDSALVGSRTSDLSITSPTPNHWTTKIIGCNCKKCLKNVIRLHLKCRPIRKDNRPYARLLFLSSWSGFFYRAGCLLTPMQLQRRSTGGNELRCQIGGLRKPF